MTDLVVNKPATVQSSPNGEVSKQTWVYLFNALDKLEKDVKPASWDDVRSLLGGKGANLAEMTRIGLPVPPGFSVTTRACNAYLAAGAAFPPGLWEQELAALKKIED